MSEQSTKDASNTVIEIQQNLVTLQTDVDTIQLKGLSREQRQIRNIAYDCIQRAQAIATEINPTDEQSYSLLLIEVNSLISTLYGAVEMLIDDFQERDTSRLKQIRQSADETLRRIERLRTQVR